MKSVSIRSSNECFNNKLPLSIKLEIVGSKLTAFIEVFDGIDFQLMRLKSPFIN